MISIISTYSLLPLVSSVLVFALGLFVWLKKPKEWLHILFFAYDFTIALWLFGTFMLFNAANSIDQLFWDRFIYVGVVFIPIFLYHFGLIYCGIEKKQQWPLAIGYMMAFIFLPLSQFSNNFVSGLYTYSWGVHSIAHRYHDLFLVYFFLYFILFFINLGIHYRHATGGHRTEVRYLLIGFGILDLIGPLGFLPAYGIPIYPVVFLSAIPFAVLLGYAIIRYNALNVKTITAEVMIFSLNALVLGQIFFSRSTTEVILRVLISVVVLVFSVILIHSVNNEIKRREEVTKLAQSLEQANLRLQEVDRQKTDFLSIASHQLRTPLSIANGYIELLHDGAYGKIPKQAKEILANMDESNGRLVKLVDEFLDITRIEQGRTKFDCKNLDMNDIIDSAVQELNDRANQKGLKIVWHRPTEPTMAEVDDDKIRHVVFNFIDNAIKYTDKGHVTVEVKAEDNGWSIMVRDHGFGFGKLDEANFFQKFYRGENVKGTNVTGTGIGLYVCRMFIEGHGGHVWAHSEGLGKGSEFGLWVPRIHKKDPKKEEPKPEKSNIILSRE